MNTGVSHREKAMRDPKSDPRQLTICLTANSSPWANLRGGGNIAVHNLATALSRNGHHVHVIYSKRPGERLSPDVEYAIHWARYFDFAPLNLNVLSYARVLRRLLQKIDFDLVHGNAEEASLAARICRERGIPFFYTSHANSLPSTGIGCGLAHPVQFLKTINCHLQRATARQARRVFTLSRFSRDLVVKGLGESWRDRVTVIPPGVDRAWSSVPRPSQTPPHLLFWGRLEDQKGVSELLRAFQRAAREVPDARLTLIGEGNMEAQYRQEAGTLGLLDRVDFAGWRDADAIRQACTQSRAGVFPSRVESFGLAIAEAMACGLPVIASAVGAIPEYLESGVTGTLVPPGNTDALSKAMRSVLMNPEPFEIMACQAREKFRQHGTWDRAAKEITGLYLHELEGPVS